MCHLPYVFNEKEHEHFVGEINELGINNITFCFKNNFLISHICQLCSVKSYDDDNAGGDYFFKSLFVTYFSPDFSFS